MPKKRPAYRKSSIRQPGKGKMPKWIWREKKKDLPQLCKQLCKFFWKFGPEGSDWWNCMLAKWFDVTPRRIQQCLKILKFYPLIAIAYPDGRGRVIRRLPYGSKAIFQAQKPVWLERHPPWTGPGCSAQRVKQISPLDNAQQKNNYTTSYSSSAANSPKPDCPPSPAEVPAGQESQETTERGRFAPAVHGVQPENPTPTIGHRFRHPKYRQLLKQTRDYKLAIRIFDSASESRALKKDFTWSLNLETDRLTIAQKLSNTA